MLSSRFKRYITEHELCNQDDRVLLAVSGGVDSMVMLHLFSKIDIPIAVAHCNFSLRGEESDGDEILVRKVAEEMDIDFFSTTFNTQDIIQERGDSLQVVARDLRYEWFEKLSKTFGFTKIAIAHNADDTVETFFINLIRGTGIKGMGGIPVTNDKKIRPILFAKRSEILHYASKHGVEYRNDSSNSQTKYLRNKIRHNIVPQLTKISENFVDTMTENIAHVTGAINFIDSFISQIRTEAVVAQGDSQVIHLDLIASYPSFDYILFELTREAIFKSNTLEDVIACYKRGDSGKQFSSSTHLGLLDRGKFIITKIKDPLEQELQEVEIDRDSYITNFNDIVIKSEILDIEEIPSLITQKNIAIFDLDSITFPLTIRYWQAGDSIKPLGMRGTKKVSDILIDAKVPLDQKSLQTVVSSNGDIIWLTSHRISSLAKVSLVTKKVLRLTVGDRDNIDLNFLE